MWIDIFKCIVWGMEWEKNLACIPNPEINKLLSAFNITVEDVFMVRIIRPIIKIIWEDCCFEKDHWYEKEGRKKKKKEKELKR